VDCSDFLEKEELLLFLMSKIYFHHVQSQKYLSSATLSHLSEEVVYNLVFFIPLRVRGIFLFLETFYEQNYYRQSRHRIAREFSQE